MIANHGIPESISTGQILSLVLAMVEAEDAVMTEKVESGHGGGEGGGHCRSGRSAFELQKRWRRESRL